MTFAFKGMLFSGILALSANTALVAQSSSWAEQWYRAKYGRPLPTEQARIDAAREPSVQVIPAQAVTHARRVNGWLEQLHREKYGRATPREDARMREANLGKDAVMTSKNVAPPDLSFEDRYQAKTGRRLPVEAR
jgi:hypothetical protein